MPAFHGPAACLTAMLLPVILSRRPVTRDALRLGADVTVFETGLNPMLEKSAPNTPVAEELVPNKPAPDMPRGQTPPANLPPCTRRSAKQPAAKRPAAKKPAARMQAPKTEEMQKLRELYRAFARNLGAEEAVVPRASRTPASCSCLASNTTLAAQMPKDEIQRRSNAKAFAWATPKFEGKSCVSSSSTVDVLASEEPASEPKFGFARVGRIELPDTAHIDSVWAVVVKKDSPLPPAVWLVWRSLVLLGIFSELTGPVAAKVVGCGVSVAMLWLLWFQASRVSQWVLAARGPQSTRKPGSRSVRVLLALMLVPAVAGQANDPCVRPCGREHYCGELNRSFSCVMLSDGLGCDCSGCCLASLSPLAPPATPPPLPPAPNPPVPLLPPIAPGLSAVSTTAELRAALATAGSRPVYLLPFVYPLGGVPLNVSGFEATLEGMGFGATIDAETMSRAIDVGDGGRLVLRRIEVINGAAESGGGLRIEGADSSLRMEQVTVRDCVATTDRGGRLACSFARS